MKYYFDTYGWLSQTEIPGRETDVIPPTCAMGQQPNWTGINWVCAVYSAPPVPMPPVQTERYITGVEFLRRFTQAQRIAARNLAKTDPIVDDFLHLLDATIAQAGQVNLLDPDTIAGVNYLAQQAAIVPAVVPSVILA